MSCSLTKTGRSAFGINVAILHYSYTHRKYVEGKVSILIILSIIAQKIRN